MSATATILPIGKLELGVNLLFYSPDEKRAQRLAARLRNLATVHWHDSRGFSPERWAQQRGDHRLVLLDYASDSADGSTNLATRLSALAPELPLLGVGSTAADRATGVLAALRAGVRDFIDMDASDEEIRSLLNRALQQAAQPHAAARQPGQLVLLLGARPGIGTSTLAAHLGVLAMPPNASSGDAGAAQALLLDLGHPAGDAALYLGVAGDFHYNDALRNAGRMDATLVRTAVPHHASRLAVLAQGAGGALPPDASEHGLLIERLLAAVDLLLCDLGGTPVRQVPRALLQAAAQIWLVADQSIGSMVSLDGCLRELEQAQVRDQRLALVINRHDDECGISAKQVAERFNLPLLARLPERTRALRTSANQGMLLQQAAPRDPYIRALAPLLAKLRIHARHAVPPSKWTQLLLRAGGFRWKSP